MGSCRMRGRSLMDRTEASDAFNAGSIPVGRSFGSRNRGFRDLFLSPTTHTHRRTRGSYKWFCIRLAAGTPLLLLYDGSGGVNAAGGIPETGRGNGFFR